MTKAKARSSVTVGTRMKDGTVFAGISPDTKKPMYIAPQDAPVTMSFNEAADYAESLEIGGKGGFRIPSKAELGVIYKNRRKGALKDTFNETGTRNATWYWSSETGFDDIACSQRFSDGGQSDVRVGKSSLRCVR